jgi:asparagine synthase (glutamine-hydrolysing)
MCGIVGVLAPPGGRVSDDVIQRMGETLRHRGPDSGGEWLEDDACVGLGHRRLSILDLSPAGRQPMRSPRGRFVVTYNGEVYNFAEIRKGLERTGFLEFRGHSDTEVIAAAFECWGIEEALQRFVGMFALAVWDRQTRKLYLIRDRLGIKPLYYGVADGWLFFASELKALLAHPRCPREVSSAALASYLRYGYVPTPQSMLANVWKVPPGHVVVCAPGGEPVPTAFWTLRDVVDEGLRHPFSGSETDAIDELSRLLREAVQLRMIADVPLGAFLSGGIDSSTVVALMQSQSVRPIRTFSIGFEEPAYDEAEHAAAIARHLGTHHSELYVTPLDARDLLPQLPVISDEPFADVSQMPTYFVARLAREAVTVSLSGDGGDELFGGYTRYLTISRFWRTLSRIPTAGRRAGGFALARWTPRQWDTLFRAAGHFLPARWLPALPGAKVHKLATALRVQTLEELHTLLVSQSSAPWDLLNGGLRPDDPPRWAPVVPGLDDDVLRMMYLDTVTYLVDDILTKLDRASMAVSLEARVPMLDHRVVAFAWRLPRRLKVRGAFGKWILRELLYRHVPRELVDRPKRGFSVPIDAWLRGPLRPWAEELLAADRLRREGYFDADAVRRIWSAHVDGRVERGGALWTILMFQAWREHVGM